MAKAAVIWQAEQESESQQKARRGQGRVGQRRMLRVHRLLRSAPLPLRDPTLPKF